VSVSQGFARQDPKRDPYCIRARPSIVVCRRHWRAKCPNTIELLPAFSRKPSTSDATLGEFMRSFEVEREQAGEGLLGRNVLGPAVSGGGGDGAVEGVMREAKPARASL